MQTLTTADGLSLLRHDWRTAGTARGRVLIVHGLGEHGGRYEALATALNRAGWQVHAHDQRGHGRSGGARGALPHADALLEDLALVIDTLPAGGPLVLLGHSMGGLVAARYVAEAVAPVPAAWSRTPAALVLSSPALDAGLCALQRLQLTLGRALMPDLAVGNGLKPAWISRDPAIVREYESDPLVHDRVTPRLVRFIVDGGRAVLEAAPRWPVPTLLMWAGADRCVAPRGSAAFAAAAPPETRQARAWAGRFHEIFKEPERAEVVSALLGWLGARVPGG
jgi:alpha-beta hydrolase superfamily lysophospholipase